jgi:hypothetical protein
MRTSCTPKLCILLIASLVTACGVQGPPESKGVYPVVDMHADLGNFGGTAVLAAPAGWIPKPTVTTPTFPVPAPALYAAMQDIVAALPRTWLVSAHPDEHQASYIVRSRAMNLPDIVIVQAVPVGDASSQAVIFSHSRWDMNPFSDVNQERVQRVIRALTVRFGSVAPGKSQS